MENIWSFIKKIVGKITVSIAFYPTLIASAGLVFFLIISFLEYSELALYIKKEVPFLFIEGKDEASVVLSTLVASIISLMVFSFSMVMIVLNRASSNLSPRVLPGLISNKSHQIVLGIYLATIIYSLLVLVNFKSGSIPSLGVFFSMLQGILCLGLFVYFIHSISNTIKVENIIEKIFEQTHKAMNATTTEKSDGCEQPETDDWFALRNNKPGFLKVINTENLIVFLQKKDWVLDITVPVGSFVVKGFPYLKIKAKKKPTDDEMDQLQKKFQFHNDDFISDHFTFGFTQLSEIAIKAMSPGINDPGTALKTIDLLSVLFCLRVSVFEPRCICDKADHVRVYRQPISLELLILKNLVPIRNYGKADLMVQLRLLDLLKNLFHEDKRTHRYKDVLHTTFLSFRETADRHLLNTFDRKQYNASIAQLNKLLASNACSTISEMHDFSDRKD